MATISATPPRAATGSDRSLLWAAALFTVAVVVHGADHVRRGADSVSSDVFWAGTAAIAVEVGVVVLACQRHRLAALAAATAGASLAVGYVVVHFLPARSWLSDSFTEGVDVSALSWTAASLEVVAAVALGLTGLLALRARGGLTSAARSSARQRGWLEGVTHPVALVMILGNAAILASSFSQL